MRHPIVPTGILRPLYQVLFKRRPYAPFHRPVEGNQQLRELSVAKFPWIQKPVDYSRIIIPSLQSSQHHPLAQKTHSQSLPKWVELKAFLKRIHVRSWIP